MNAVRAFQLVAVLCLSISMTRLEAQRQFKETREKVTEFYNQILSDPADRVDQKVSKLHATVTPLITAGVLDYLQRTPKISPAALKMKILTALADPSTATGDLKATDGTVSIIPSQDLKAFAIAYDIATCASCSTSWLGIFELRDGHWTLASQFDNPTLNDTVHLAWLGSGSEPLLALYGIHWGDPHNRLDVRLYSTKDGLKPVWSKLDLPQGKIAIQRDSFALTYWTANTPWESQKVPYRQTRQVFEVDGQQVHLQQAESASAAR